VIASLSPTSRIAAAASSARPTHAGTTTTSPALSVSRWRTSSQSTSPASSSATTAEPPAASHHPTGGTANPANPESRDTHGYCNPQPMKHPCDEAVIRSGDAVTPCAAQARTWILAATILGSSMAFIDGTVVNVALPALQTSLRATVVDVQWVIESYGLLLAALILVGGSLGDLFGRRLIFLLGVVIFALASAGCGMASNIHQLLLARSVQGIGQRSSSRAASRLSVPPSTKRAAVRPLAPGPALPRS